MAQRDSKGRFVSTKSVKWTGDLSLKLNTLDPKLVAATTAAVEYHATKAQARLRHEAPWKDQTGNARNGLFAKAFHSEDKHVIVLYHSVPYGVLLEVRHSGRYAVLEPVRNSEGRELMITLSQLLRRIK